MPSEGGRMEGAKAGYGRVLFATAFLFGVVARFLLPHFGFNYDLISYGIVSDVFAAGGNVYAETERYNYGPAWFLILGAVRAIAHLTADPDGSFRLGIVAVLTLADLAIALMLERRFGAAAALIFFLNPVSMIITGYHNQFDNVAIAAGLAAVLAYQGAEGGRGGRRRRIAALCLLGLSLTVKHIFFALPLWLAFRAGSRRDRALAAGLPVAIFVASFLPFARTGWQGILHNVFLYKSFNNGLVTRLLHDAAVPPALVLVLGLAATGWLLRKRPLFESALLYLVLLVILAPAMANQYLAIPMPAVAAAMNPAYAVYLLTAFLIVLSNVDGLAFGLFRWLGVPWVEGRYGYDVPVVILGAGLAWQILSWRRRPTERR